jgi:hypothetical protein
MKKKWTAADYIIYGIIILLCGLAGTVAGYIVGGRGNRAVDSRWTYFRLLNMLTA